MTKSEVFKVLKPWAIGKTLPGDDSCVSLVTCDSRKIEPNAVFVAVSGTKDDGNAYIDDAVAKGAGIIVHSNPDLDLVREGVCCIQVSNPRKAYAALCDAYFDYPSRKLKLVGVTGTNGKTSTVFLIQHLLLSCGIGCGVSSTVLVDDGVTRCPAERTTPDAFELSQNLAEMVKNGCEAAVLEVSSHALDQNRLGNARFDVVVFTNLTGDHLDYHGGMDHYFESKKRLFTDLLAQRGVAVVNSDDPYGREIHDSISNENRILTYGMSGDSLFCQIREIRGSASESEISIMLDGRDVMFKTHLIGRHNAYNLSAAICAALGMGCEWDDIRNVLDTAPTVPGRLERIELPSGAVAFVDYAHTDDALENVLSTLRPLTKGRLIVVMGCGGDRDRSKRPRMGAAAAKYADSIILTNDNPRGEDPLAIIAEIKTGIHDFRDLREIPDRRGAIEAAVSSATNANDVVVIAGKGHETTQEIAGICSHFDDREEVRRAAKST